MGIQSKVKSNTGEKGLATVTELSSTLRVVFDGRGDVWSVSKTFGDGEWPYGTGKFHVTLDKSNAEIKFVGPAPQAEPYLVRFAEFGNRGQSNIPEPKLELGGMRTRQSDGQQYYAPDKLLFTAKLEIIEGPNKGMFINHRLPYIFVPAEGNPQYTQLNGTRNDIAKIEEFLKQMGMDLVNEDIPFSPNVLVWLEGRFKASGKILTAKLNERGYLDSLSVLPDYLIPQHLLTGKSNGNGKAKAKAPAKKAPAKSKASKK